MATWRDTMLSSPCCPKLSPPHTPPTCAANAYLPDALDAIKDASVAAIGSYAAYMARYIVTDGDRYAIALLNGEYDDCIQDAQAAVDEALAAARHSRRQPRPRHKRQARYPLRHDGVARTPHVRLTIHKPTALHGWRAFTNRRNPL